RDIIPMARSFGMALAPWGVLGQGKFLSKTEVKRRQESGEGGRTITSENWEPKEDEILISRALEKVANEVGAKSLTAVAIAYVMQKTPYVFPIIGGRKVEHLVANLEALEIELSDEQIKYLESIVPFQAGFPSNFIASIVLQGIFLIYRADLCSLFQ
ncbi:hypothetical protein L218DRAFT_871343, partial [Marasmius fiardii PR-910]